MGSPAACDGKPVVEKKLVIQRILDDKPLVEELSCNRVYAGGKEIKMRVERILGKGRPMKTGNGGIQLMGHVVNVRRAVEANRAIKRANARYADYLRRRYDHLEAE